MIFDDIKKITKENDFFRHVIYTGKQSQLVLMSLLPREKIGMETHPSSDQILFIVDGEGEAIVGNEKAHIAKHSVIFVPANTSHNIVNNGNEKMKLYTLYAPSTHADGLIHKTKADAAGEKE